MSENLILWAMKKIRFPQWPMPSSARKTDIICIFRADLGIAPYGAGSVFRLFHTGLP